MLLVVAFTSHKLPTRSSKAMNKLVTFTYLLFAFADVLVTSDGFDKVSMWLVLFGASRFLVVLGQA